METYKFNAAEAFGNIAMHWVEWEREHPTEKWIIGLSGGKDSAVCAALAAKIFGKEKVLGVVMPNGEMDPADLTCAKLLCKDLGIDNGIIQIEDAYNTICMQIEEPSVNTKINLPARLRMSALFAVSQSYPTSKVICTGNLSEDMVGYSTLFGDMAGSYAPIMNLTTVEVVELGKWLGLNRLLVEKTPSDGLCGLSDEEKLGISYDDIHSCIRLNDTYDFEKPVYKKIYKLYKDNKFKLDMIQIPHPKDIYPNYITGGYSGRLIDPWNF